MARKKIEVEQNWIDRVVSYVSPIQGARRFQARAMLAVAGGYVGGSRKRRTLSTFRPGGGSADADLLPDLANLRERSRDLERNSPIAVGAVNTAVTSVVGPGLKLQCAIDREALQLADADADAWERRAEQLWSIFANTTECDVTRTQTFMELQSLVFRSALVNGDVFSLLPMIPRRNIPFDLRVTLIEADRVKNKGHARDTKTLAGGVALDEHGAPTAYHIMRHHPGTLDATPREWDIVPAFGQRTGRRNVLHHFDRRRVGQTRGAPYLAPIIEPLKQLEDYTEAELMAAVVSGMFTVFVKNEEGDATLAPMQPTGETSGSASDEDYKLANGAIVGLGKGESIETANPGRPNAAFDPFVKAVLEQVGMALEIPFEVLIKHFTASYSAARAALLEAWRFFRTRRAWLIRSFCDPVYEAFIWEMVARGLLPAPGFLKDPLIRHAYLGAEWIGRPMGHIQPMQEAQASRVRVELGVSSLTKEVAEIDGGDWADLHQQRVKEIRRRREDGVEGQTQTPAAPAPPALPDPNAPPAPDDRPDRPEES